MASFGIIFSGGPTLVTQGARRAPVPKGVRHRDCCTPTLVWAVTIEMHRTPPHEVGGWGRPQAGRLLEKRRRRFSACQVARCSGMLRDSRSSSCLLSIPPSLPYITLHSTFQIQKNGKCKSRGEGKSACGPWPHVEDPRVPPVGTGASGLGDQCEDIFIPHAVGARW